MTRNIEQHQGDPVALPARKPGPTETSDVFSDAEGQGWNACLDEIAKLGPLYPRPVQGEPFGWLVSAPENLGVGVAEFFRNAEVVERLKQKGWKETPLYTHADPDEVERLSAENEAMLNAEEDLLARRDFWARKFKEAEKECDTLRAQVEKLQAGFYQQVTDEDLKKIADYVGNPDLPKGAFLRQDAYDLANMCMHMVREVQASRIKLAERDALLRALSGWTAETSKAVLEAFQAELDESASYAWYDAAIADLIKLVEAIPGSAEPSAPVERDERAEFEKAVIDKAERFHPKLEQYGEHPDAEYRDSTLEWCWGLWQARAALERKP
jgi:hypothetical protein